MNHEKSGILSTGCNGILLQERRDAIQATCDMNRQRLLPVKRSVPSIAGAQAHLILQHLGFHTNDVGSRRNSTAKCHCLVLGALITRLKTS